MSDNPFANIFGDIFHVLGQQGPDAWFDTATQMALSIARGEDGDPNPLPTERAALEQWAPLVERHVDALLGVARDAELTAVNRSGLASAALAQWRPLVAPLVARPVTAPDGPTEGVDQGAALAQMIAALGPLFTGFQMGSVAGHFTERAWSLAALALPRERDERILAVNNLAAFAESWSLERDEVYVFALAQESVASLVLARPGTGDALRALLLDTVAEAAAAQGDLLERLSGLVDPEDLSALVEDPAALLEGITPPDDSPAVAALNAATAALSAFFDAAALSVVEALLGPRPALAEAYRRHRRSDARGEDAAAALFGISLQGEHHDAAREFVAAVGASEGLGAFSAFLRVDGLPRADELADPAAWRARVESSPLA
ncbi:MAG TPA: zinc-dependent metalloprotease [Acidimicrobiales bacterium]|nr:zinc-dependent metalloprotease [Acidimicrobiales bacterium]